MKIIYLIRFYDTISDQFVEVEVEKDDLCNFSEYTIVGKKEECEMESCNCICKKCAYYPCEDCFMCEADDKQEKIKCPEFKEVINV